jgi:hypothetical protein
MRFLQLISIVYLSFYAFNTTAKTVTIEEAVESTKENNVSLQSLQEYLVQADAAKSIGWGMIFPKLRAEAQWLHLGERHTPDMSAFADMGAVLGTLVNVAVQEHPNQADAFLPYMDMMTGGDGSGDVFSDFIPPSDTLSGTFSLIVPVFNPQTIPLIKGSYDQYDATVQRIGYGREQLLFAVCKAYYGLLTLQSMVEVNANSLAAANEHFKSNKIKADLQAATQLEVKRAELEVTKAESQKAELTTQLEKAKAAFRYLTGIKDSFDLIDPKLVGSDLEKSFTHWFELAMEQRKDLLAAKIEVLVAEHEVDKVLMKYVPSLNLIGQIKADNAQEQRFDDDPFSWTILATMSVDLWDGGIREAELDLARSRYNQAKLGVEDIRQKIESEVSSAWQALKDAQAARVLADRQLDVALETQKLALASEGAGVVTNLEVIDTNTMVFFSEAQALNARFSEAMAILDLLAACGQEVPFIK